jgi:hypothetical protein
VVSTTPGVNITATTLNGNSATANGGGLYVSHSNVALLNDTFKGNTAVNGGAIGAGATAPNSTLALENQTIDLNTVTGHGGGLWLNHAVTTLHNTILIGNAKTGPTVENCWIVPSTSSTLTSNGYNLANDGTCHLTATGDELLPTANAALGLLQNNGGPTTGGLTDTSPTLTQLLGAGSTALDLGDPTSFPATDERNAARPQGIGPRSDIGAVEMGTVPTPTPTSSVLGINSGVKGIIAVPKTGGEPGSGSGVSPFAIALVAGLLSLGLGALVSRRRTR